MTQRCTGFGTVKDAAQGIGCKRLGLARTPKRPFIEPSWSFNNGYLEYDMG